MKKLVFIFFNLLVITANMKAQQDSIAGVYELTGVREMASGFKLNADSTFEFYLAYGALDRYGSGKWQLNGNKIIFNSKDYPGADFKLLNASNKPGEPITITIEEKNKMLLPYVYAFANALKEGEYAINADSHGVIRLQTDKADSLHLLFEFVPERLSAFAVDTKKYNQFSFAIEPWLFEYFFKNYELTLENGNLSGKHPLMEKEDCVFEKQQ